MTNPELIGMVCENCGSPWDGGGLCRACSTMGVAINPGSGPVVEATEAHADRNMVTFLADCLAECPGGELAFVRVPEKDMGEGRFCFFVINDHKFAEIQMLGLPLEQVRFMDPDTQNIWDFPRLYVDEGSWVWRYALLDADFWKEQS